MNLPALTATLFPLLRVEADVRYCDRKFDLVNRSDESFERCRWLETMTTSGLSPCEGGVECEGECVPFSEWCTPHTGSLIIAVSTKSTYPQGADVKGTVFLDCTRDVVRNLRLLVEDTPMRDQDASVRVQSEEREELIGNVLDKPCRVNPNREQSFVIPHSCVAEAKWE